MGKKKIQRNPRKFMLMSKFTATTTNATIGFEDGRLIIKDDDGDSLPMNEFCQQQLYERISGKGDKVLNQAFSDINTLDIDRVLTSFDFIYGADTNTIQLNELFFSFGVLAKCEITEKTDTNFRANISLYHTMESSNCEKVSNIENYFWIYAIKYILDNNSIPIDSKVALVVDSDFSHLEKFNKQEKPIAGDFYLPQNFSLIYASADSGAEYLANKVIRYCDRIAKDNLRTK